jgi:N-acetylglutamate synthase-like GNAT family acetyltransferase
MEYRRAIQSDMQRVQELVLESGLNWEISPSDLEHAYVCVSGTNMVGFTAMRLGEKAALGTHLLVHPVFRNFGIGRKLVQLLCDEAIDAGEESICMQTQKAPFYFRAQGMMPCAEKRAMELENSLHLEHKDGQILEMRLREQKVVA